MTFGVSPAQGADHVGSYITADYNPISFAREKAPNRFGVSWRANGRTGARTAIRHATAGAGGKGRQVLRVSAYQCVTGGAGGAGGLIGGRRNARRISAITTPHANRNAAGTTQ